MPEVILAILRRPEETDLLLDAAACLAKAMGPPRINALAVQETVQLTPFAAATLIDRAEALVAAGEEEQRRVISLKTSFDRWTAQAGEAAAAARWFEAGGGTASVVAEWGSRADVIVAGRPAKDDPLDRQAFRAALFGTDRPVLMVPPEAGEAFGRRVAIAWRDEKQAIRAVLPALRWLAAAEQVHVLVGVREQSEGPGIPRIFLEHGITARVHVLPIGSGPFGQTLLDKAHEIGADLLVMGAYAHSPLRELILGGVTRYMLARADLPVLMRH